MQSTIPTVGVQGTQGQQDGTNAPLRDLDMGEFIKLMVTELQNQDPLNPMENSEILTQISQIREIEASDKMTKTLNDILTSQDAVLLGQSLSNAGNLIGKKVTGEIETRIENEDGEDEVKVEQVTGVVDKISILEGQPVVHIGEKKFPLAKVTEVRPG
jgi:flagellar basal-body rod modification protein FlgD